MAADVHVVEAPVASKVPVDEAAQEETWVEDIIVDGILIVCNAGVLFLFVMVLGRAAASGGNKNTALNSSSAKNHSSTAQGSPPSPTPRDALRLTPVRQCTGFGSTRGSHSQATLERAASGSHIKRPMLETNGVTSGITILFPLIKRLS